MRFIHFTVFICAFSLSLQDGSCSYILDALQHTLNVKLGLIKDIPNRIPTPSEIFEFGKNALIGFPMEVIINIIHEFCKYSQFTVY